ncbi:hypothetical protein HXX76_002089 [Chlamydomonas incerta]|uniref:Glycosyltransferase n=1 Tax=Chlamydomonas incerta TaxID=51695 RepID=A0A835WAE8_CHLIN|nr:hypothetical protein HXX76_002089 [Chlamydomonas incerta]|eukprot:KAG2443743.1 hypothetical protein HXX76_002089 [Chlamydomonas incerta]
MANEEALEHTVPLFLESLRRVPVTDGEHGGRSLDQHLVLVAWSEAALTACQALNSRYGHKCVRDAEHTAATGSFGFHDAGFNSLGFAKIKYILNGLSTGHDVVFLDTDIIVLQDPLPYFLGRGADMWGSMEKCMVYPDNTSFHSAEFKAFQKKLPPLNIGVLYFKATAGVTRCVYSWLMEMYSEVLHRPRVWDQDLYGKVMVKCTAVHELRWQVLDPRLFQSACFPGCGCSFPDAEVADPERVGKFAKGHRPDKKGRCSPEHFSNWLMRHFPCSGLTHQKAKLMTGLMEGFFNSTSAIITRERRRG